MTRILSCLVVLAIAPFGAVRAQTAGASDSSARGSMPDTAAADSTNAREPERGGGECFRFVFGEWNPPLDAKTAGHAPLPSASSLPHAPGGRDWAFSDSTTRDIQLMLYPSFWPAGVVVRFPHVPRTLDDTVRGRALALVADGRVESPEADALAWLVPCGGERSGR